jgi:hypothetical protein
MSLSKKARVLMVCVSLQFGVLAGVPMRPDEIQEFMHRMNLPALAHVLPSDADADDDDAPGIAGEWLIKQQQGDLVCTFDEHAGVLSGSCRPATGTGDVPISGKVQGRDVEWQFEVALALGEKKQTVTYIGTLDEGGASMKGTFSIGDLRGEFEAQKQ